MIRIPIDKTKLQYAEETHANAIVSYVKNKDISYQKKLYKEIHAIPGLTNSFHESEESDGDGWNWLRSFILLDVNTLRILTQSPEYLQFDEFEKIYSSNFSNGSDRYVDKKTRYNAYSFLKNIGVTVCPYCEEEYLHMLTKGDKRNVRTSEIDHFFPKSQYRALAMCFFNLVPCGQNCNGIKKTELLGMNPYEEKIEAYTNLFPDIPVGINIETLTEQDCAIQFHARAGMILNVDVLRLEERYEAHKDKAYKYLINMQQYSEEKIDEMVNMGYICSKEWAYHILFDVPLASDHEQKLLTKLRHDITGGQY